MKEAHCSRQWEAEAVEDERLVGTARTSFERHVLICSACQRERAVLERLRTMTDDVPSTPATPLDRRRLRAAILREGNQRLLATTSRTRWRLVGLGALAFVAAVAVAFTFAIRRAPTMAISPAAASKLAFEIVPVGAANWHVDRDGDQVEVKLETGRVAVQVTKLGQRQRFLMKLPDGELEVQGTRFVVQVVGDHTHEVSVSEGAVDLRLAASQARTIRAGEAWAAPAPEPPSGPSNTVEVTTSPAPQRATKDATTAASKSQAAPKGRDKISVHAQTEDLPVVPESAGAAFAKAMGTYSAGAYENADALLGDFARRFPDDTRNEDAAFLRIVIQQRLGDAAGAQRRAREYLKTHPNGLRKIEVERIVR